MKLDAVMPTFNPSISMSGWGVETSFFFFLKNKTKSSSETITEGGGFLASVSGARVASHGDPNFH